MTGSLAHTRGPLDFAAVEWSVGDLLRATAAAHPERTALTQWWEPATGVQTSWTYDSLLAKSTEVATRLLALFKPGEHIALWSPGTPAWIFFEFGAMLAGLVLVPVNAACKSEDLKHVLAQSGAAGLYYQPAVSAEETESILRALGDVREQLRHVGTLQSLMSATDALATQLPRVSPKAPALVIFTSGTTGNAKGAILSHRSLVNAHKAFEEGLGLEKGSTWMNCTPLHTIAGCGLAPLSALWNAGTQLLLPRFQAESFFRAIEDGGANWAAVVPTMGLKLLEYLEGANPDLASLQAVTIGGAPIAPELAVELEQKLGAKICSIYGQSEAAAPACQVDPDVPIAVRAKSAGKALGGRELRIADPTTGQTLPCGTTGEICIRGFVMDGYYGQPRETAAALDGEGWLHTGDLGELSVQGELTITGRLKDMIISGGMNVYPREIEDLLLQHPDVAEAAVFGVADRTWGEIVVAAVRLRSGAVFDSGALRQFVACRLARFKVPSDLVAVDTFPLTASGKIQKLALRDTYVQRFRR